MASILEYDEAAHDAALLEEGREEERANTEAERRRADAEKQRADAAELRAKEAEDHAKEVENHAKEADAENERLTSILEENGIVYT